MKVIPQYKVIGPYYYDRIIYTLYRKKYVKKQDIGHRQMERCIYFKNKKLCNSLYIVNI